MSIFYSGWSENILHKSAWAAKHQSLGKFGRGDTWAHPHHS